MKNPSMSREQYSSDRRKLLKLLPLAALAACNKSPGETTFAVLGKFQNFNDWFQAKVFDPDRLAPEYEDSELTPLSGFRVNGYDTDEPEIDMANWKLKVDGLVEKPGEYSLDQIRAFPKKIQNTRHVCVEGWSMIPKWGGSVLRELLDLAGADPKAKYLSVECADGYYTTYDMPSARHAQTLLCYEAYGEPLSLKHGAPVRIVMPTKLGYKQSKWLLRISVTNEKKGGYWEDQGYDWFGGI